MGAKTVIVGTVGRDIEIDTEIDLTEFVGQTLDVTVQRPDKSETTWTATIKGAATGGILLHTLALGDIDQKGTYKLHSHAKNATKDMLGDLTGLDVLGKFDSRR